MKTDEDMTYAEQQLAAMLAAGGEVSIRQGRRIAMRERVIARASAAEAADRRSAPRIASTRRGSARSLITRVVAVATAISVFGGGAVAWASEGAMPGDVLYPVKRAVQAATLAAAPTASLGVRLAIRMADDRLAEAGDIASSDPEGANELAAEAQDMLYEAAAQAGGMSAEARDEVIARLIAIGVRQREHLMEIAAGLPDAAQAGIMRAIARAGGEARARAIEVHLAQAERRVAARARVRAAERAAGAGSGVRRGVGRGAGRRSTGPATARGQDADEQHRPPGAGDGGAEPGEQGQGKGAGAGGQSGAGSRSPRGKP